MTERSEILERLKAVERFCGVGGVIPIAVSRIRNVTVRSVEKPAAKELRQGAKQTDRSPKGAEAGLRSRSGLRLLRPAGFGA